MKILALSGSLRATSVNTALLRVMARLAAPPMTVVVKGVGELPLFNPDLESALPDAVFRFRAQVSAADALVIASPEYAHGVSGPLKNALDWLVSDERFAGKPVAVLPTSAWAQHAGPALRETLLTLSATLIDDLGVNLPWSGAQGSEEALLNQPAVVEALHTALAAVRDAVVAHRTAKDDSLSLF